MRHLSLLLLLLTACGRTEPVRGYETRIPIHQQQFPDPPDAGPVQLITAGDCLGPQGQCPRGFHCEDGTCVLNGGEAPLQVTLQWKNTPRTPVDLDLHLVEPLPVQGSCEIYYGTGGLFSCGAVGKLDLDANAACVDSDPQGGPGADTENIIYPPQRPVPSGHYIVRVDYWSACDLTVDVPFLLTVRRGATVTERTGTFRPAEADEGAEGAGRTLLEFDVP